MQVGSCIAWEAKTLASSRTWRGAPSVTELSRELSPGCPSRDTVRGSTGHWPVGSELLRYTEGSVSMLRSLSEVVGGTGALHRMVFAGLMVAPEDTQAQGRALGLLISSGVFGAEGADVLWECGPQGRFTWAGCHCPCGVAHQVPRPWPGAPTRVIPCHSASCPGLPPETLLFSALSFLPVLVWYDFAL